MKQKCLISRLDEPNIAHLFVIEWDQNLINNIRVLCTRNPEMVKYFVPEELFWKLKNGETLPMTAECYDEYGVRLFAIDPLKVLAEQVGVEDDDPAGVDGLEIRLKVEGFAPAQPSQELRAEALARPLRYQIGSVYGSAAGQAGSRAGRDFAGGSSAAGHAGNHSGRNAAGSYPGRNAAGSHPGRNPAGAGRTGSHPGRNPAGGSSAGSGPGRNPAGGSREEDVTFRRRRRFPIKEIILAALILAAAAGVWILRDTSVKRFEEKLSASNYKEAVAIYNEEICGHEAREEKADPQLREAVEDVRDSYMDGNCGYEDACAYLNILAGTDKKELSQLAQSALDEVERYEVSSATIAEGTELMEARKFPEAIEVFLRVEESSAMYSQAQEKIGSCVNLLAAAGDDADSEEECLAAIDRIDAGLELLPENEVLTEGRAACLSKYRSLVRDRAIAEADGMAAEGDFAGAFDRLDAGMEVLGEDEELGEKIAALRKEFVDHVTRQALARVDGGDFEEAKGVVEDASEIYTSEVLGELLEQIAESEKWAPPKDVKYDGGMIRYTEYPGELKKKNKKKEFTVKAAQTGGCVWEFTRMESALKVQFLVKAPDGTVVIRETGLKDGSKVYGDLEKDQTYTLEVSATEGEGGFVLLLGQNKAAVDISAYNSVSDSVEFKGQCNGYFYVPENSGTYRFDLRSEPEEAPVKLEILDENNRTLKVGGENRARDGGTPEVSDDDDTLDDDTLEVSDTLKVSDHGDSFTAELAAGSRYRIEVSNSKELKSGKEVEYTFSIGKPEVTEDVTGRAIICGALTYSGQKKSYTFKVSESDTFKVSGSESESDTFKVSEAGSMVSGSGLYRFTVGNMESGRRVKMYLYSSLGERIGGADDLEGGDYIEAELTEGQGYQLQLTQVDGTGEYTITVAPQQSK